MTTKLCLGRYLMYGYAAPHVLLYYIYTNLSTEALKVKLLVLHTYENNYLTPPHQSAAESSTDCCVVDGRMADDG
jgi:hypothetical protein